MKKHLLLLMMALLPMAACAYDAYIDGIYYNFDSGTKTATVTYKAMYQSDYSGKIVIPDVVTYNDVTYSVISIDEYAFYGNANLESVIISNSVKSIGKYAFDNCTNLSSVIFGNNVVSIGDRAFSRCINLKSVNIPECVTHIGVYAFAETEWYNNLDDGMIYINNIAFQYKGDMPENTNVTIKEGTVSISTYAFSECKNLTSVDIPNSVTNIGDGAFSGCSGLTSIEISNGVTTIGEKAFYGCSGLTSVTIPNSVNSVGHFAFMNCLNLTSIYISDLATWCNNEFMYGYMYAYHLYLNGEEVKDLVIPDNVTKIVDGAFQGCVSLASLTIPGNVKSIGYGAFEKCTGLTSVDISEGLTSIGFVAFSKCSSLASVTIPNSVTEFGNGAFSGCENLRSLTLHTSKVANWFAGHPYIQGVTLGEEVTEIANGAFADCSSLKSVTLSDNITKIGESAFETLATLLTKRGSKTLLTLWNAGYTEPKDVNTSEILAPTSLLFTSSTQCTAQFHVNNIYQEYETTYDGFSLQGEDIEITGLKPDSTNIVLLKIMLDDLTYETSKRYTSESLNLCTTNDTTATSFVIIGEYDKGDAEVIAERMEFDDNTLQGNEISAEGLEPSTDYEITYVATVRYGENGEFEEEYRYVTAVRTDDLVFNTLPPKVVSKGEVVVAAESNLPNDELKVGFEWRRNDAPEELESKSCEAFLYNGTTEGILHYLTSFSYWRYRPYYESASGKRFYGGWGIVEADDDSYFEPTVHTYANIEVTDNTAQVNGYALNGTDEVLMLGFMYWMTYNGGGGIHNKAVAIPTDAKTVELDNKQQRMKATLTDLDYDSEYSCVAFVTTTDGKTFYGEEQKFSTGEAPAAIGTVESNNEPVIEVARYNLNGQLISSPQKGVNIIRYSDGTSKKIYLR